MKKFFTIAQAGFDSFFSTLKKAPAVGTSFGKGVGDLRHHELKSRFLASGSREVVVYLPPSYWQSEKRYPVLYMHDGQNLFDASTGFLGKEWFVDEKVEYLIGKGIIEEIIVVGVYHGGEQRIDEYTWKPAEGCGGQGKRYARFLTKELKPFIDQTYRTLPEREHTAVMGSSLGGIISFYLAKHCPKVFGKIAMMSPALDWDELEDPKLFKLPKDLEVWLDMGTEEREGLVDATLRLEEALAARIGRERLHCFIHEGAEHSEDAWATRVHAPLIQFFGRGEEKSELIRKLMNYENWASL